MLTLLDSLQIPVSDNDGCDLIGATGFTPATQALRGAVQTPAAEHVVAREVMSSHAQN